MTDQEIGQLITIGLIVSAVAIFVGTRIWAALRN